MMNLAGEPIDVGSVRDITIPVDGAEIGARVYTPEGAGPHPVVVFFHGGGWVICSLDTHDNLARAICRDAEAVVVSVDYRMAPEHRYPTAVHDCFAATRWVADNAAVARRRRQPARRMWRQRGRQSGDGRFADGARRRRPGDPLCGPDLPGCGHDPQRRIVGRERIGLLPRDRRNAMVHEPLPGRSREGRDDGVPDAARGSFAAAGLLHRDLRVRPATRRGRGVRRCAAGQRRARRDQALRRPDPRRSQR